MQAAYRIESINDFLAIPAERRQACFRELELALLTHELAFGDGAQVAPVGVLHWTDDSNASVELQDIAGQQMLRLEVSQQGGE